MSERYEIKTSPGTQRKSYWVVDREQGSFIVCDCDSRECVEKIVAALNHQEASADDTKRLDYIVKLARERQIWITHIDIPKGTVAFEKEGAHRWIIGGQGVGNTGRGKTLNEAIDAALDALRREER